MAGRGFSFYFQAFFSFSLASMRFTISLGVNKSVPAYVVGVPPKFQRLPHPSAQPSHALACHPASRFDFQPLAQVGHAGLQTLVCALSQFPGLNKGV